MDELAGDDHSAIATRNLTKHYGPITALDDVDLVVPKGSIYGFLGPNGAGKTTTIKILMGFIKPTSGTARIFGHETWNAGPSARATVGFLVQPDNLFTDMSGTAHLDYAAHLSRKRPVLRNRLLDALELSPSQLKRRLGSYSKGMRQKLALTAAIQHQPSLLILDEPTDGLDPLIQRNFEEVLRELNRSGTTIFMSSHDLSEVERTCELVAVVKSGKIVAEETIDGLKRLQRRRAIVTFAGIPPTGLAIPGATVIEQASQQLVYLIEGDLNPLLNVLAAHRVEDVVLAPPSLDDIFMGFYDQSERSEPAG